MDVVEALLLDHLDALGEEGVAGRGGQGAGGLGGTRVEVAHVALTRAWQFESLKEKSVRHLGWKEREGRRAEGEGLGSSLGVKRAGSSTWERGEGV